MGYFVSLVVTLCLLWLTLSGYYTHPLLLTLGVVSVIVTMTLTWRMRILDGEAAPYFRIFAMLSYWGWLFGEIVKSNLIVCAIILRPDMTLTPRLIRVKSLPKTGYGRALFANSITLTPGTVSVDLDNDEVIVHTLMKEMTDRADFAEMARRCAKAAGEKDVGF